MFISLLLLDMSKDIYTQFLYISDVHSVHDLSYLLHIPYHTIMPIYRANRQMFTPIYIYLYELDTSIRRTVGDFLRKHHVLPSQGYPLSTFMSFRELKHFLMKLHNEYGSSWSSAFTVEPSEVLNVDTVAGALYGKYLYQCGHCSRGPLW